LDIVELDVTDAGIVFNDGNLRRVLQELIVSDLGTNIITAVHKFNVVRLRLAERATEAMTKETEKRQRQSIMLLRKGANFLYIKWRTLTNRFQEEFKR
ncbi:hypothetical protein J6590_106009, partial [Homalodisca vitripennis]